MEILEAEEVEQYRSVKIKQILFGLLKGVLK